MTTTSLSGLHATSGKRKIASFEPYVGISSRSGSTSASNRRPSQRGDRLAQLGQPRRPRIARRQRQRVDERALDELGRRLDRIAHAEVDQVDARAHVPPPWPRRAGRTDTSAAPSSTGFTASSPKRLSASYVRRERRDLDALVLRVRVARRAGAEVHGVEPLRRELGDRSPRLLRLEREAAGFAQRLHERRACGDARRRRVAEQLQLACAVHELAQARLGLLRSAVRRVTEVERRRRRRGDHVGRDAAVDLGHAQHLAEDEPLDLDVVRLEPRERAERLDRAHDRVVAEPRPRRVRALPVEDELARSGCRGSRPGSCCPSARA